MARPRRHRRRRQRLKLPRGLRRRHTDAPLPRPSQRRPAHPRGWRGAARTERLLAWPWICCREGWRCLCPASRLHPLPRARRQRRRHLLPPDARGAQHDPWRDPAGCAAAPGAPRRRAGRAVMAIQLLAAALVYCYLPMRTELLALRRHSVLARGPGHRLAARGGVRGPSRGVAAYLIQFLRCGDGSSSRPAHRAAHLHPHRQGRPCARMQPYPTLRQCSPPYHRTPREAAEVCRQAGRLC